MSFPRQARDSLHRNRAIHTIVGMREISDRKHEGAELAAIKARLEEAYGGRLRGVVLYGSSARGEVTDVSDLDILVLLDGPVLLGTELRRIIDVLYDVQLESDRPIHALPVDADTFEAGEFGLYRNAKHEGTLL